MREDAGAALPPYVLDVSALTAVARGDAGVMSLVQALDGQGRPLVIPVLAVTAASLDARSDDADELLEGLQRLENVLAAPVQDAEQAVRLAAVVARTNLDRGTRTSPQSAPFSPPTRPHGGSMHATLRNRCTLSRSPNRAASKPPARRPVMPRCPPLRLAGQHLLCVPDCGRERHPGSLVRK